jgi:hypothetical protein
MPLPLIIAAIATVLLGVVGVSVFNWRVYVRGAVGPVSGEVGVGGPGAPAAPLALGDVPWIPIALAGLGAVLLLRR